MRMTSKQHHERCEQKLNLFITFIFAVMAIVLILK